MPAAYGKDRVSTLRDACLIIAMRDKGWTARYQRSATNPETPGTAVEWDGQLYEVVGRNESGEQVRYRLEPWKPSHAVRRLEQYDADSEVRREQQWEADRTRYRIGRRLERFGVFTGHLPIEAKHHLTALYGVSVNRITLISILPLLVFGIYCSRFISISGIPSASPPFPQWVVAIGLYFFFESLVRLIGWLNGKPMGSPVGWTLFVIWWLFGGRKILLALEATALQQAAGPRTSTGKNLRPASALAPTARDKTGRLPLVDAEIERKIQDLYVMREAYISLLSAEEQRKMESRFGFDPIRQGKITAAVILVCTGIAAVVTLVALANHGVRLSRLLSFVIVTGLAVEQIHRLTLLAAGQPASSILAPLVRPFLRKVLDAPPRQPFFEGEKRDAVLPEIWDESAEITPEDLKT
ncbi:MAG TPA: hypothetical protein VNM92_18300 [Thermoanaerobaculia bacterium]|nr:hypothetical protein [Thermoanaerobaculia bacterium]